MQEITIAETFFPFFSLGTLVTGLVAFGFLSKDRRASRVYWSVFLLLVVSLLAISLDTGVLVFGGILKNFRVAVQLSRLHEVATSAFLFVIPLFFTHTLPATHWEQGASRIVTMIGAAVFGVVLVVAFVAPDLFVSVTRQSPLASSAAYTNAFGRGTEGPLFVVRDIAFGLVIPFSLGVSITASIGRRITGSDLFIVAGISIGILLGGSAVYANFTGYYPGPLNGVPFSRVGLGLTVFTLFATAAYVHRYVAQTQLLDETNRELQHRRDRLAFLTYHDEPTQMLNKQALVRDINLLLDTGAETQAVAYLFDIDDFRDIIEAYGFSVSDQILRIMGRRIEQFASRFGGTEARAYRLNGDRFAIVIPDRVEESTLDLLEHELVDTISHPVEIDGRRIFLSVSAGQCSFSSEIRDAEVLLRRLRHALGEARRQRNVVRRWVDEAPAATRTPHEIAQAIQYALRNDEFTLHYQPIVDRRGRVVAAEALLRWEGARPEQFIPVAEETGLVAPLTEKVVSILSGDLPRLLATVPDLRVFINVSARRIGQIELPTLLSSMLDRLGIPPSALGVEITETSFMDGAEELVQALETIRRTGIIVAIDDFGTGYSSLSYLKRLPADRLKIDRSFIRDLPVSRADAALVDSVAALGRRLEKRIVAEGVETRSQYQYLITRDIDFFQGFFFSTPLSSDDFVRTVAPAMQLE